MFTLLTKRKRKGIKGIGRGWSEIREIRRLARRESGWSARWGLLRPFYSQGIKRGRCRIFSGKS